ncbi:penicillin-binding protein [Patescibacteria group bacterium]
MAHRSRKTPPGWKYSSVNKQSPVSRKRRLKKTKHLSKNLFLLFILLGVLGSLFTLGVFAFVSRDLPDPNTLTERTIRQTTKIYDRTNEELLYEIFGEENRTLVKIQEGYCKDDDQIETDEKGIPIFAIQATMAAEDRKFCSHSGFDFKGFARAVLANLRGRRVGGSTLTQQLVKNAILSNEKTITRKIKELILSLELERRYSKDEIVQIYFNEIPYGSTYYGIQAASLNYFGKTVDQLSLPEAATLAALPQAPTRYVNNPDQLKDRRNWIIDSMADLDFITRSEAETAKNSDSPIDVQITNIKAPHFVLHVKEMLEEKYGQRQVEEGGLKVTTSIDYELQKIAEEEVVKGVDERSEQYEFTNAALVAINPKDGHVLSMVGSKDYFDDEIDGQVNVTTRLRQPGSSFKPIVYTKAFEMGYTPNTVLWDVKTDFSTVTGTYSPNNYDLEERGPVRVRKALQGSLNIPAVKMVYLVGVENTLDFADDLGYTSFEDRSNFGLSVVLGGGEVKLLEHTNAYATFANQGIRHDPVIILKVEDAQGEILEEWKESDGKEILDENIANMITDVLSDNNARAYAFGLNSYLQLGARPVAAKTGTTNDYHDAWTMGYTPSLAAGVWAGNNDNTEMARGAGGSAIAAPIWNGFMKRALENKSIESFPVPEIKTTGKHMLDGLLNTATVVVDKISGKKATEFTPPALKVEKTFAEYHNILHYVDRADILGEAPLEDSTDRYYQSWEKGVEDWITNKEEETGISIEQSSPPTEEDDVHVPENFPSIRFISPREDTELTERDLEVEIAAESKRGITRVEFYLDGFFLGSDDTPPHRLKTVIPSTISRGYHTLKAVAYDDVENSASDTRGVKITTESSKQSFELIDPKNGQTIERTEDDFTVVVSLENPERFSLVSVYSQPIGPGERTLIEQVASPQSPFLTFTWPLPVETGDWVLSASAAPKEPGLVLETVGIVVHVKGTDKPDQEPEEPDQEEEPEGEDELPSELPELNPFIVSEGEEEPSE